MRTQILEITTTYNNFLSWLNEYTLPSDPHYPPTLSHPHKLMQEYRFSLRDDDGYYKIGWELWVKGLLDVANIDPDKLSEPKRALTIRAYQTPQPSDTPRYLDLNRGIEAIKLEIVKQEPLQIQFFCYLDEIQDYFYELLMGIAERWGDEVVSQLQAEHLREMPRLAVDAADKSKWEAIVERAQPPKALHTVQEEHVGPDTIQTLNDFTEIVGEEKPTSQVIDVVYGMIEQSESDSETVDQTDTVPPEILLPPDKKIKDIEDDQAKRYLHAGFMKQYYKDYVPTTAKDIIDAYRDAWDDCSEHAGRWGPGYISRHCNVHATTVGRYNGALKKAGYTHVNGIEIP